MGATVESTHSEDGCHHGCDAEGPCQSDSIEQELIEDGHVLSYQRRVLVSSSKASVRSSDEHETHGTSNTSTREHDSRS